MEKDYNELTTAEVYQLPIPNAVARQCVAARIVAASDSGTNAHALVNEYNLKEKKKKLIKARYDKKGITISDATIDFAADCARPIRHSRTLTTNLKRAGHCRLDFTDAHHIVATIEPRAHESRQILFSKQIGINDADNGGFFKRYIYSVVVGMEKSHDHQGLHTDEYYVNVELRLLDVASGSQMAVRLVLRAIKSEIIAGTFPK